jgi:hypothetical protein
LLRFLSRQKHPARRAVGAFADAADGFN